MSPERAVRTKALLGASATSLTWRHRGATRVSAIVKATFRFALDGSAPKPIDPLPILFADEIGPDGTCAQPHDLAPRLGAVDVLVRARACAPLGRPVAEIAARLEVVRGAQRLLDKSVLVAAGRDGAPPGRFSIAPLPASPRGLGPVRRPPSPPEPVVLPDVPDVNAFQAAPADQRLPRIEGSERFFLHHVHPARTRIEVTLPEARGRAQLLGPNAPRGGGHFPMVLDHVAIDVDRGLLTLLWRGDLPVERVADHEIVGWVETSDAASGRPSIPSALPSEPRAPGVTPMRLERASDPGHTAEVSIADLARRRPGLTMPFQATEGAPNLPEKPAIKPAPLGTGTVGLPDPPAPKPATPFERVTPKAEPAPAEPDTRTLTDTDIARIRHAPVSPFRAPDAASPAVLVKTGTAADRVPTGTVTLEPDELRALFKAVGHPSLASASSGGAPIAPPAISHAAVAKPPLAAPPPARASGEGGWFEDLAPHALDVDDDLPKP